MLQCFINKIQWLLVGDNTLTSDLLNIDSIQYIDEFYIIHWNMKYYLTVSANGTYGTSSSNVTEISNTCNKLNVN